MALVVSREYVITEIEIHFISMDVIILVSYVLSVTCLCFIYVACRSGDHVITNIQVSSCWRFSLLIASSVAAGII